jgi:hypothetical protein
MHRNDLGMRIHAPTWQNGHIFWAADNTILLINIRAERWRPSGTVHRDRLDLTFLWSRPTPL